jgi:cobalt-zinc-cadmium efflux system membrane fusion protein
MTGVARVMLPGAAKALAVPEEALVEDGAEAYVLIEEAAVAGGSRFQRRNVTVGRRAGGWAEVAPGGLFPGDRVVTRGAHQLGAFFVTGVLRPSPEAARAFGLRVGPAALRPVAEVLEIDGSVELPPQARAAASARLGGTLVAIHARPGQTVKAGDVLAEVAGQEALGLQLDLLRTHLEGQLLAETLARLKEMGDSAPRRRVLEAEGRALAARQARATLRRKLLLAGLSEADLAGLLEKKTPTAAIPVRAPISGTVVSFDGMLGQAVKAEGPLFTVHDLSRPLFVGHLSEAESARVRIGQRVRVRLSADPAFVGQGQIARSGRTFGTESRTLAVWVEPSATPSRPLRDGQLARLTAVLEEGTPRLAVPLSAIVREGARAFVFVRKEDNSFERREVALGRADDLHAEVVRGLSEGEPVAVEGAARLQTAFAVIR